MASYHTKTIRLLDREPQKSQRALDRIQAAERRLGVPLPLSVRDWYSYAEAIRILAAHSNEDPPIPIDKWKLEHWDSNKLLPFKHENQGVCAWSILLDGSDDPPVYVNVDVDDNGWQLQSSTFSDYLFSCVWDYAVVFAKPALVQAQNPPVSDGAIAALAAKFGEVLRTHGWPGSTQYRFGGDPHAILIWSATHQADWFAAADDAHALRSLLEAIGGFDAVGQSWYACSEIAHAVLEESKRNSC